jgi:hypothetical protein
MRIVVPMSEPSSRCDSAFRVLSQAARLGMPGPLLTRNLPTKGCFSQINPYLVVYPVSRWRFPAEGGLLLQNTFVSVSTMVSPCERSLASTSKLQRSEVNSPRLGQNALTSGPKARTWSRSLEAPLPESLVVWSW